MSEKPPQPEIVFVAPEGGDVDWGAYTWNREALKEDIDIATGAYRHGIGIIVNRFKDGDKGKRLYWDVLERATKSFKSFHDFSKEDLIKLTEQINQIQFNTTSQKGPASAVAVRDLYIRALRMTEAEYESS